MSAFALALLLAAAGWNLLLKGASNRLVVMWLALIMGSLVFLPVLLAAPVPRPIWPFVVASAAVECGYYLLLTYAYGQADFSQVYPLARGAAPLLLAVWAAVALREVPSALGCLGLVLVAGALVPLGGGAAWWKWGGPAFRSRGVAASFGVALCISVYSLIDGVAVRQTNPAPYTVAITLVAALMMGPPVLVRYGGRAIWAELRGEAARIVAAGVLMVFAYTLVLRAYAVAPLAYAGAVREVGVVIAALAGWLWLGESFGARRLWAAVAVFLGIVVLAVAR